MRRSVENPSQRFGCVVVLGLLLAGIGVAQVGAQITSGIDFSPPYATSDISGWAIRDGNPYSTTLLQVSLTAPADGFVVVSACGTGCIYSATGYVQVWLSDSPDNSAFSYLGHHTLFSISNNTGSHQACGVGQASSFAFQHVQSVTGNRTYTFYVKGNKGSAAVEGRIIVSPLLVVFYPARY